MSIINQDGGDVRGCVKWENLTYLQLLEAEHPAQLADCPQWKEMFSHGMIQLILRCVSKVSELIVLMMVFGVYCLSLLATV